MKHRNLALQKLVLKESYCQNVELRVARVAEFTLYYQSIKSSRVMLNIKLYVVTKTCKYLE